MFLFFCCVLFFLGVFLGGFKGQVRWPEGPPHLALNPPYFFVIFSLLVLCFLFFAVFVVFSFLSLLLSDKKLVSP